MSSQKSVGESRVSHPTPGPRANSDADHFGPATEEEMEADLKRIDTMEEDLASLSQEVTSCERLARCTCVARNIKMHLYE